MSRGLPPHRRAGAAARAAGALMAMLLPALSPESAAAAGQSLSGSGDEPLDRVLAVVNGQPVTFSEVAEAIAFETGHDPPPTVAETLERLIDARLMEAEARRYPIEPPPEMLTEAALRALKDRFATAEAYRLTLVRFGIAEDYLRKQIRRELIVDQYIDRRFRPLIQVIQRDVEEYYETVLAPDLDSAAAAAAGFSDVEEMIRDTLEARDLNRRVAEWVEELRSTARIVRLPFTPSPPTR